jgi:hypothetical protein
VNNLIYYGILFYLVSLSLNIHQIFSTGAYHKDLTIPIPNRNLACTPVTFGCCVINAGRGFIKNHARQPASRLRLLLSSSICLSICLNIHEIIVASCNQRRSLPQRFDHPKAYVIMHDMVVALSMERVVCAFDWILFIHPSANTGYSKKPRPD